MKVLENKKICIEKHNSVTFIRIEITDLKSTIESILSRITNLSWLKDFDEDYIREGYRASAEPTIDSIKEKLENASDDNVTGEVGETIISELSKNAIVTELKYSDIPLSEIYSKKRLYNPGFDFHTVNKASTLIFGEAKYVAGTNAYGVGLSQVTTFLVDEKDYKDLPDLDKFIEKETLNKVTRGEKGFAIGFSATKTKSDIIISGICRNKDFNELLAYEELILVAVNL